MIPSLPRATIRTLHANSPAKTAEHAQSFCRCVIFDWLALSMRMQVILDSSFARPGWAPIWGGKKGEFRDWTKQTKAQPNKKTADSQRGTQLIVSVKSSVWKAFKMHLTTKIVFALSNLLVIRSILPKKVLNLLVLFRNDNSDNSASGFCSLERKDFVKFLGILIDCKL